MTRAELLSLAKTHIATPNDPTATGSNSETNSRLGIRTTVATDALATEKSVAATMSWPKLN